MSRRTLLTSEQRTRLFGIPTDSAEMAKHYVLSAEDLALIRTNDAAATDWASPSRCACCGIRAKAWTSVSIRPKR